MIHVYCPLCRSDDARTIAEVADYTESFRNVICARCALVYADPQPTSDELSKYYQTQFIQGRHQIETVEQARERALKKGSREKYPIDGLRDGLTSASKVLEIGCSYGFLLHAIQKATGASVEGVEPNEISGAFAREEFHFPVRTATVEEYLSDPISTRYDLIIISHVLEHLADPVSVLRALSDRLAIGGRLYVCVPDVTNLQEPPETFFQVPHLTSFSPWSFSLAAWQAGLKPIRMARKLAWPKSGMEFDFVPVSDPRPAMMLDEMHVGSRADQVWKYIQRVRRRYAALRQLKRGFRIIVPSESLDRVAVRLRRRWRALRDRNA